MAITILGKCEQRNFNDFKGNLLYMRRIKKQPQQRKYSFEFILSRIEGFFACLILNAVNSK